MSPSHAPRKRGLATVVLGFACLLLAACGTAGAQGTEPNQSPTPGTTAVAEMQPAATPAPIPAGAPPGSGDNRPSASTATAAVTASQPAAGVLQINVTAPPAANVPPIDATAPPDAAEPSDGGWLRAAAATPIAPAPVSAPPAAAAPQQPARTTAAPPQQVGQLYRGVATYYGSDFDGRPMAAGPTFNMMDPTVTASNYWPLGTKLRVWRVAGGPWDSLLSADERSYYFGHSIIVTVLDRGAFTHALDLSYGAFAMLGRTPEGVISIMIQPLDGTPPSWQLAGH